MKVITKKDFLNYILSFTKEQQINFDEDFGDLSSHQIRALFTSYCLMYGIDSDIAECDSVLMDIFNNTGHNDDLMEKFNFFMLELIV